MAQRWGAAEITDCKAGGTVITISGENNRLVGGLIGAGKEMMEGSDVMSSFIISDCAVSGKHTGGGNNIGEVVGDPACAVSVDCEGGMTISPALDAAP